MKRILLFCFLFVSAFVGALAQGEVVIGTNLPVGSTSQVQHRTAIPSTGVA